MDSNGLVEKPIWIQSATGNDKWGWKRRKSHCGVYLVDYLPDQDELHSHTQFLVCFAINIE